MAVASRCVCVQLSLSVEVVYYFCILCERLFKLPAAAAESYTFGPGNNLLLSTLAAGIFIHYGLSTKALRQAPLRCLLFDKYSTMVGLA